VSVERVDSEGERLSEYTNWWEGTLQGRLSLSEALDCPVEDELLPKIRCQPLEKNAPQIDF
jgi:hypothetical protein